MFFEKPNLFHVGVILAFFISLVGCSNVEKSVETGSSSWSADHLLDMALVMGRNSSDTNIISKVENAHWVDESRIAFVTKTYADKQFSVFDLQTSEITHPLDAASLAVKMTEALGRKIQPRDLALHNAKLQPDNTVHLSGGEFWYHCTKTECKEIGRSELFEGWPIGDGDQDRDPLSGPIISPDGSQGVDVLDNNLVLINLSSGTKTQITYDGVALNGYGNGFDLSWSGAHVLAKKIGWVQSPSVLWSPDSRYFVSFQLDLSGVRQHVIVDSSSSAEVDQEPTSYIYPYAMAKDDALPRLTPIIVDTETNEITRMSQFEMTGSGDPINLGLIQWTASSEGVDLIIMTDEGLTWSWWRYDRLDGVEKMLVSETYRQVPVETVPILTPLSENDEMIIWSQRDDFGRLYRYDGDGSFMNAINTGSLHVTEIVMIDETVAESPWVYFLAGEERTGVNPYDSQLYRSRADGSQQELLGPGDVRQQVQFSQDAEHYFSVETRADQPDRLVLYTKAGKLVQVLGEGKWADHLHLDVPERYKIDLGGPHRDVFGVIFPPINVEPGNSYPLVHYVYGGHFTIDQPTSLEFWDSELVHSLRAMGMGVFFYDGLGTSHRRYSFNMYPPGTGYEHCNLHDAATVLDQLAEMYDWIDKSRVGVAGWSNGGYCALRAMLDYSSIYSAGVSVAGNHDQRLQHFSVASAIDPRREGDLAWERQSNLLRLEKLEGPLLLIQGEIDESVVAINTLRVVQELTRLGKEFEFMYFPGEGHSLTYAMDAATERRVRFFYEHLVKSQYD